MGRSQVAFSLESEVAAIVVLFETPLHYSAANSQPKGKDMDTRHRAIPWDWLVDMCGNGDYLTNHVKRYVTHCFSL